MRTGDLAAGTGSNLEEQLAQERTSLTEMRQRYSEDHPDIKHLERTIQNQKARIAAGGKEDARSPRPPDRLPLRSAGNAAERSRDATLGTGAATRGAAYESVEPARSLQSAPEVELTYDALNRDAVTAQGVYEELNNQRTDAEVKAAAIKIGTADRFTLVRSA